MSRADEPAFPEARFENDPAGLGQGILHYPGLTKRELISAMAMQGTVANPSAIETLLAAMGEDRNYKPYEAIARVSVAQADALLLELSKEKP